MSKLRRKGVTDVLTEVEKSTFFSLNSSLGRFSNTVSPFYLSVASRLQQYLPYVHVSDLIKQKETIQKLKRLETSIYCRRPSNSRQNLFQCLTLLMQDARRTVLSFLHFVVCSLEV